VSTDVRPAAADDLTTVAPTRLNPPGPESERVELAGIKVADTDVLILAIDLRNAGYTTTADLLDDAVVTNRARVGLTIKDREAILTVLVDPTRGLTQLRAVLLEEHILRKQTGL
jgi:hypothetical protein